MSCLIPFITLSYKDGPGDKAEHMVTNQELWFCHALSYKELTAIQDAQIRFSKELTSEVHGLTFKEQ